MLKIIACNIDVAYLHYFWTAMQSYKDKHVYVNLVSNYFNTWSITNSGNGGDNVFSFKQKLDIIFDNTNKQSIYKKDISLAIFQFTQFERNPNYSKTEQIEFVNHYLTDLESFGITCVSIIWPNDFVDKNSIYWELFKDRHVDIEYRGNKYTNFEDIIDIKDNDITVMSDFSRFNFQKNDKHLNLKGHQMLADSIIKKLNNDGFSINTDITIDKLFIDTHIKK